MKESVMENAQKDVIKLDAFLKFCNVVSTGGQAKILIQDGKVSVNDKVEIRRGCKLHHGDHVTVNQKTYIVECI